MAEFIYLLNRKALGTKVYWLTNFFAKKVLLRELRKAIKNGF